MGWLFSSSSFNTAKSMECFNEKLVGYCASCDKYNLKQSLSNNKRHCARINAYLRWNEPACSRVSEIDPETVDCVARYYDLTGRRYFILTAIFEILGIPFENRLYTKIAAMIQSSREDMTTRVDAIEYDIVGMDIANCLRNDADKTQICADLLNDDIVKIYCLIETNKTDEAMIMYREMVKKLYVRYRQKDDYAELIDAKTFENNKIKTL